ncbi:MAG: phosphoglycerate dehydrogenase [Rhizobiales bacterium]|nr:phosphoglycerate dehydrogenase [Hyphomicrobiales bacterium]MBA68286.1 phosphoglycerate dehydrogenase [Hyphomicrobiales bacterium]|tara:strand:- start:1440 stop:2864 length:1425 start_codon:yes stop_codon:yes gene_type:complete
MTAENRTATGARILICDLIGLRKGPDGVPDPSEARAYIEETGGAFHAGGVGDSGTLEAGKLHYFYLPHLSTEAEFLAEAGDGQYDAVIAAASFIPEAAVFPLGGVRIGAGTGNMGSRSWGGPNGGGDAPLMNTPGINSRTTAQMVFKAILKVRPDLDVDDMANRVAAGDFDTGKDLRDYPTTKLEGLRLGVVGYGNIGREVAKLGRAFGMDVTVHARPRHRAWIESEGFRFADDIVDAARDADVFSVHVGLGARDPETGRYANAGLVGGTVLSALADNALVVNYDRGELVDVAALGQAMRSGKVGHAAIDADLFKDASDGALSGPMLPYLDLVGEFGDRLELLPHAAADTDHPTRVAGARQAVDQIRAAILDKRVINGKGKLPTGYTSGGGVLPKGIGGVDSPRLANLLEQHEQAQQAAKDAATIAAFFEKAAGLNEPSELRAYAGEGGEDLMMAMNRLMALAHAGGLDGPFSG